MNIVCLCTALPAESRPLIEHFRLKLLSTRGFRCYNGDSVCLVETGIGKLKAAAAVASVLQNNQHINALINIGIAGGIAAIGTRYLANSIVDKASEKHWYPHLPAARTLPNIATITVHTLDKPSGKYQSHAAFDMEASGVMAAASSYLDNTRIQCLKTISDNTTSDITNINRNSVTGLIAQCIEPVQILVDHYRSQPVTDNRDIELLIEQLSTGMRISVSDIHTIKRLLQRYNALSDHLPAVSDLIAQRNAKQIKIDLECRLSSIGTQY